MKCFISVENTHFKTFSSSTMKYSVHIKSNYEVLMKHSVVMVGVCKC